MSREEARSRRDLIGDDDELIDQIEEDFKRCRNYTEEWREEAHELYDLVAGDQWDEANLERMRQELRPPVTFNVTQKYIDAVTGLEIGNRQEVRYLPRTEGDAGVNEVLTAAAHWVRDECDAEDEETEAFTDLTVCGMGWTETHIATDENPDGDIIIERRDPLEMYWDTSARKKNLEDAKWIMRVKPTTEDELLELFPEYEDEISHTDSVEIEPGELNDDAIHDATNAWRYEAGTLPGTQGKTKKRALIHYEWCKVEGMWKVETKQGVKEFTRAEWVRMREFLDRNAVTYNAAPIRRKRYYRAFASGRVVFKKGLSPYQYGFTHQAMTGRRDRNKNCWYGLGRVLRDPQLWLNKFMSQILHIINSNAKGGTMALREAFENPAKAESEWARPDSITWMEFLTDDKGNPAVVPKPQPQYPTGLDRLMNFTVSVLPEVSGLNLELLGLTNKVQPGVLEAQRKAAGMTMIAWAFDSKRRYTKCHGRLLAHYIKEYISDGRLIRVIGEEGGQKYVPLVRQAETYNYDVIVEESPSSPNQKDRVWAILSEVMPSMLKFGMPIPPEVVKYAPLPEALTQKWVAMMQPDPEQQKKQQEQEEIQKAAILAEVEKTRSEAQENEAETVLAFAKAQEAAAKTGKIAGGG